MNKRIITIGIALSLLGVVAGYVILSSRAPKIRNIVLISIDTCRADYLSCYGYPRETTPHIDALAKESTRFEHVVSPVPITLPSHSTMLTGTIPPFHGVHDNIGYQLAPSNHTLAEILKQNGFNTAAIIGSFVLDRERGLLQGFDTYDDAFKDVHKTEHGVERRADETAQLASRWLETNKGNRNFLFLHFFDPHKDYDPPEPFASRFSENLYAGEIAYADHCIGQVIEKLKELRLYDSTLLIITGDHGEMLGEHGESTHAFFIYESAIRVPLIIKLPGQAKGATISQPVGLVDIVPTLCSLLALELPGQVQGLDITPFLQGKGSNSDGRPIYSESILPTYFGASSLMAVSTAKWKYIQAPRPELYDLSADPAEEHNLVEKEHQTARILKDQLREMLEQSVQKDPDSRIKLDAESIKRLESLGYIAGTGRGDDMVFDDNQVDPKDRIYACELFGKALTVSHNKEYQKAKDMFTELAVLCPDFFEAFKMLGDLGMRLQQYDEAVVSYRRAIELNPEHLKTLNNLAWIQATRPSVASRDVDEALRCAKKVCSLIGYNYLPALETLSVSYAACGDFEKAAEIARKARALAISDNNVRFEQEITYRIELFEQSKPYVEE